MNIPRFSSAAVVDSSAQGTQTGNTFPKGRVRDVVETMVKAKWSARHHIPEGLEPRSRWSVGSRQRGAIGNIKDIPLKGHCCLKAYSVSAHAA